MCFFINLITLLAFQFLKSRGANCGHMVWPGPRGQSPMIKMIGKPGSAKELDSGPFMKNPIKPNLSNQTHQTKPIRPA